MTDVISALSVKKARLAERKRQLKRDFDCQIAEIDAGIREVDRALQTINGAIQNYLCPVCRGTGNVRKCDAAGQMEDVICPHCNGTGIKMEG